MSCVFKEFFGFVFTVAILLFFLFAFSPLKRLVAFSSLCGEKRQTKRLEAGNTREPKTLVVDIRALTANRCTACLLEPGLEYWIDFEGCVLFPVELRVPCKRRLHISPF